MANRYDAPIVIPKLNEKLAILYRSSPVDSDSALGRKFRSEGPDGITGSAVRAWVTGDRSRDSNMVPANRFDRLVEIFRDCLPGDRTEAETRALLTSPTVIELHDAFLASAPPVDWMTLVQQAELGGFALIPCGEEGAFGITTREGAVKKVKEAFELEVEHLFRFKVPPGAGWLTVVQGGESGWFGLELADNAVSIERSEKKILFLPKSPYLREGTPGIRSYVFITTFAPLAPDLLSRMSTSIRARAPIDAATLDRFAYVAGEVSGFKMNRIDVQFVPSGDVQF